MTETQQTPDKQRSSNRPLYILIGVLLVGIVGMLLFIAFSLLTRPAPAEQSIAITDRSGDYDGSTWLNPPREVKDFTLTDQTGQPLSLSSLRGKIVLMTFGFTHCPDICPLTLNEMKEIRDALGEGAQNVAFVFISVDGARDTPQVLANYFAVRNISDFIGLTGEEADLRRIGVDYGLFFELGTPDERGLYNVDHTAGMFLIDQHGHWAVRYAYGTEQEVIIGHLQEMLANQ